MVKTLNDFVIDDAGKQKSALIRHIVGSGLNDHSEEAFYQDLEGIQSILKADTHGQFAAFRQSVNFDKMMGRIGQHSGMDPETFLEFQKAAQEADVKDQKWRQAFSQASAAHQTFRNGYNRYRKWGRVLEYVGVAPVIAAGYLGGHFVWGMLDANLQVTIIGVLADLAHEHLRDWLKDFQNRKIKAWMPEEYKALRTAYETLLAADSERTVPYLIREASEAEEEGKRFPAMEELALDILTRHPSPETTEALIEVGVNSLRVGNPDRAMQIFKEVRDRNPGGVMAQLWPEMKEAIQEARETQSMFSKFTRFATLKKAAICAPLAALGIWGSLHYLHGMRLQSVLIDARDMFLAAVGFHLAREFSNVVDKEPMEVLAGQSQEKMMRALKRLEGLGQPGVNILDALANNKMPGRLGAVFRKAAKETLQEMPNVAAAHRLDDLNLQDFERGPKHAPTEAIDGRRDIRGGLCQLDFSSLGKALGKATAAGEIAAAAKATIEH
jgi:hypothetical protein